MNRNELEEENKKTLSKGTEHAKVPTQEHYAQETKGRPLWLEHRVQGEHIRRLETWGGYVVLQATSRNALPIPGAT